MQRFLAINSFAAGALLIATVSATAACGAQDPADDPSGGYGEGLGTPENPVPQPEDKGPYAVTSRVDFTVEAILPAQAELVVATLRAFSENPAGGLIAAADAAGVPAVKALYDAIPGIIKDKLEGWINGEIAKIKINGITLPQYAGMVAALAETALTQFELDSTLTMKPGEATHTLTGIDFGPTGIDVKIPISGLAADILTQHPTITVAEGGALGFGDQRFGLNFGDYAWDAINHVSTTTFGGDIRSVLGKAMNCPALAHTIASKCVGAFGAEVCVGHENDLKAICEGGLDQIVGAVHSKFVAYDIDAFRFKSGSARLVDDDSDGVADRIVDGTWDGEMNIGMGLRHTPATFTATR
ncbi:MAG TPA: hypothetical protein VL326_36110 [Kofleriaceae bacterium]|jgi:hypothetical protein|nr:hypothetical protein [Kofleriaceae bacterium]